MNQFSEVDEFSPSLFEAFRNLEDVNFSLRHSVKASRFFATLSSHRSGNYFSQDIVFPSQLFLNQSNLFLFNFLSSYLKFRMILEVAV